MPEEGIDSEDGEPEPEQPGQEPKAEGKKAKRKIDLKSRLSSVRATGTMAAKGGSAERKSGDPLAFPPPPVTGSVPAPKLPGISAPAISSPFAPEVEAPKPTAQQQTIKVEVGEEIVQERAKAKSRSVWLALLGIVIGLAAGFQVGGVRERGKTGFRAVEGATALSKDVEAANKAMITLSDALLQAVEKLGQEEYPDELAELLQKTNVPFSAANFDGKGVGGLPSDTLTAVLGYTSGVEDLNKQKDKLRNLLGAAKPVVEKFVQQKKKPVVNFSVIFERQDVKIVGQLVPNKEPFDQSAAWPDKYKVAVPAGKESKDVDVERYSKGEVIATGDVKLAIPMDEKTVAGLTSFQLVFSLRKALADIKDLIDGVQSPDPRLQTDGLLKDGERLIEQLRKIGQAS